jgi:hypothetical protein
MRRWRGLISRRGKFFLVVGTTPFLPAQPIRRTIRTRNTYSIRNRRTSFFPVVTTTSGGNVNITGVVATVNVSALSGISVTSIVGVSTSISVSATQNTIAISSLGIQSNISAQAILGTIFEEIISQAASNVVSALSGSTAISIEAVPSLSSVVPIAGYSEIANQANAAGNLVSSVAGNISIFINSVPALVSASSSGTASIDIDSDISTVIAEAFGADVVLSMASSAKDIIVSAIPGSTGGDAPALIFAGVVKNYGYSGNIVGARFNVF